MEPIISDRGTLYICDGYLFTIQQTKNRVRYARCTNRRCRSRTAFLPSGAYSIKPTPHNHPADEVAVEVLHFKTELKKMVVNDRRPLKQVFDCVSQRYPRAAKRVGYATLRATLYRYRRLQPPLPHSLLQFAAMLESEEWAHLGMTLAAEDDGETVVRDVTDEELDD
uniref:FLYWCH-type domain-containing protein n=1 Tax=Graphocephala atropunctata TaxID=36148 RepID=A0A1B6MSR5_9HEMI